MAILSFHSRNIHKWAICSKSRGWYVNYFEGHHWSSPFPPFSLVMEFASEEGALEYIDVMKQIEPMPSDCCVVPHPSGD